MFLVIFPSMHSLGRPLEGLGYQFWSGIGSDFGEVTLVGTLIVLILGLWHQVNCHEHRCLRLAWHKDTSGHPVCKPHHGEHPARTWFRTDRSHPRHRPGLFLHRESRRSIRRLGADHVR